MNRILTIVGPTAVGKTRIAMEIAKKTGGEIISADSRQIYKYLNIGTAKPTNQERHEVPFHLIDFIDPDDSYSCGQFARDAEMKIENIKKRGHVPIVCGGTGLYIKALFNPFHKLPQSDRKIKGQLINLLNTKGLAYLYLQLLKVDPLWVEKIKPNDKQRILRGLEIYEMTGKPLSEFIKKEKPQPRYAPYYIGLNLPRDALYCRIDKRFDYMIENGLVEEIKNLLKKGFNPNSNALRTIGYKEIVEYITGNLTLEEAIIKAKQHTKNFAKRQITWFSNIIGIKWHNPQVFLSQSFPQVKFLLRL